MKDAVFKRCHAARITASNGWKFQNSPQRSASINKSTNRRADSNYKYLYIGYTGAYKRLTNKAHVKVYICSCSGISMFWRAALVVWLSKVRTPSSPLPAIHLLGVFRTGRQEFSPSLPRRASISPSKKCRILQRPSTESSAAPGPCYFLFPTLPRLLLLLPAFPRATLARKRLHTESRGR